jgi:hypothetical protein
LLFRALSHNPATSYHDDRAADKIDQDTSHLDPFPSSSFLLT